MNPIRRKKNGGTLLIEPLARGYNDLKEGDEYVHLGKHHRVLLWASIESDDERIGRVVWDYNVKDRARVISKFQEVEYTLFTYNRILRNSKYVVPSGATISVANTYTNLTSKIYESKKKHGTDLVNIVLNRREFR
jgi:hypothetical protein